MDQSLGKDWGGDRVGRLRCLSLLAKWVLQLPPARRGAESESPEKPVPSGRIGAQIPEGSAQAEAPRSIRLSSPGREAAPGRADMVQI